MFSITKFVGLNFLSGGVFFPIPQLDHKFVYLCSWHQTLWTFLKETTEIHSWSAKSILLVSHCQCTSCEHSLLCLSGGSSPFCTGGNGQTSCRVMDSQGSVSSLRCQPEHHLSGIHSWGRALIPSRGEQREAGKVAGGASPHNRDKCQCFCAVASFNTEHRDRLDKVWLQMVCVRGCRLQPDSHLLNKSLAVWSAFSPTCCCRIVFCGEKHWDFQGLIYDYSLLKL